MWFQTRINKLNAILDMVSAKRNVYLAVRKYVFAWEMTSVMAYIRYHRDGIYAETDMVSRYMNVKVNCFYSQVDTATKNVPNMSDIA